MKRILIIEDDTKIQKILQEFLKEYGYETASAYNGVEGIKLFKEQTADLVLLDIMLPKIDGYAVLEIIRQDSDIPVIMLTALEQEDKQLKGFDLHADDYITKPFSMNLLIRRIEAVLRRSDARDNKTSTILTYGDITLDVEAYELRVAGKQVPVTHKELELIRRFLEHRKKVYTREELLDSIWGYGYTGDDTVVNNHIMRIRKKLGQDFIITVRGLGYKLGGNNED